MILVYVVGAAAFYVATIVLMKLWPGGAVALPAVLTALAILAAFTAAAAFEVAALRAERLGFVYCAILAVEALLIAALSALVFGETYTAREIAGGAMVLAGVALAST